MNTDQGGKKARRFGQVLQTSTAGGLVKGGGRGGRSRHNPGKSSS